MIVLNGKRLSKSNQYNEQKVHQIRSYNRFRADLVCCNKSPRSCRDLLRILKFESKRVKRIWTVLNGYSWWRHQMETFSVLLALCVGNSAVPVNSPHKGQWRGALMFSLICAWINDWVNNREAGDLRRHRGHYDVYVMLTKDTEYDNFVLNRFCKMSCSAGAHSWIYPRAREMT